MPRRFQPLCEGAEPLRHFLWIQGKRCALCNVPVQSCHRADTVGWGSGSSNPLLRAIPEARPVCLRRNEPLCAVPAHKGIDKTKRLQYNTARNIVLGHTTGK